MDAEEEGQMRLAAFILITYFLANLLMLPAHAGERGRGHGGGWGHHNPGPRYYPRVPNGTEFWGGVVGGMIGGWLSRPEPPAVVIVPPPPVVVERTPEWCAANYQSYNWETGTFTSFDGRTIRCP
jgi:hypothetical protein